MSRSSCVGFGGMLGTLENCEYVWSAASVCGGGGNLSVSSSPPESVKVLLLQAQAGRSGGVPEFLVFSPVAVAGPSPPFLMPPPCLGGIMASVKSRVHDTFASVASLAGRVPRSWLISETCGGAAR